MSPSTPRALAFACLVGWIHGAGAADPDRAWNNPADRYADAHEAYLDATCPLPPDEIDHFVYFARDRDRLRGHALLTHPRLGGAQIMYGWKTLEPERDRYDFTAIEADLEYLGERGKRLWVQLQDATFLDGNRGVPDYLLTDEFGGGAVPQVNDDGATEGWTARRWDPAVQDRFSKLLTALGERFDGRIAGINLQETAIGVSPRIAPDFTPDGYAEATRRRMTAMKSAFRTSATLQYANFMPGEWLPWEDEGYLSSIFRHGESIGVGLGAPDLMVTRRGQLNHALAMMHEHEYTVPLGIAVQDGNYVGVTGAEEAAPGETPNLVPMLHAFARDFLGVDYLFWVDQPPHFEHDLLPCLE